MKIGLIGAGRLGICLALLIEQAGHDVIVSDIREKYVEDLQKKRIDTNEPDVQWMLGTSKRLTATTSNDDVIKASDIIFTLVPTPSLPDGSYDVSCVWDVVEDFQTADFDVAGKTLVVGCTTNPGDCDAFQKELVECGVSVVYNPEFIAQGTIIRDLQRADMVLIGGKGDHIKPLKKIYKEIQVSSPKIHTMSATAAELVKLAVNCFLTTKISYANMVGEVLALSGRSDEIDGVLKAIGSDSRIGKKFLNFGYGYGGPCLPRDNRSFAACAKKLGLDYDLGTTTDKFNDEHARFLVDYFVDRNKDKLPFAFNYVSYKPHTDIITESQQYRLCVDLLDMGYKVYVVDDLVKAQCDDRIDWGTPDEEVFWIDL